MLDIKTVQLKEEADIIASWKDKEKIVVSVVCATFNHELYIEDAITGFLMQETDFAFEIIIHDDASTDKTADIVRKYQNKYPKIIRPIYQIENQYSKGGFKPSAYTASFAKGEYIALCEGDDYWIDNLKIVKQVLYLNKNLSINLSVHNAYTLTSEGLVHPSYSFPSRGSSNYIIDYKEVYCVKHQFSPTASMLIRKVVLDNLPSFFYHAPVGDFFIEALSGQNGIAYLPDKMSVYRRGVLNSWSSKTLNNKHKLHLHNLRMIDSLDKLKNHVIPSYRKYVKYKKQPMYRIMCIYSLHQKKYYNAGYYFIKSLHGKVIIEGFFKSIKSLIFKLS